MSDQRPDPAAGAPPPPGPVPPTSPPTYPPPPGPPPAYPPPPGPASSPPGGWAGAAPGSWAPHPGGWAASPPPHPAAPLPGFPGAAHRPGAVPLRPLGLSDMYDAAFRTIRFNPRATVGAAVLVAAVAMALPLVVSAALTGLSGDAFSSGGGEDLETADVAALLGTAGAFLVGAVLVQLGTLLVTGVVVRVCLAAAVGRRLGLGEAWAETRGQRWRLVGLSLLVGLVATVLLGLYTGAWVLVVLSTETVWWVVWGVVSVPLALAGAVVVWIRVVHLAVPALMAERCGVVASLRRSTALTRRQFWRTFGITLLTLLVTGIASQVLSTPLSFVASFGITALGPEYALLAIAVSQALAVVVSAAFTTPFTAAVTSMQYLDQRMRKEAYDVELVQQAGLAPR